jgi:hypothetical protein
LKVLNLKNIQDVHIHVQFLRSFFTPQLLQRPATAQNLGKYDLRYIIVYYMCDSLRATHVSAVGEGKSRDCLR